MTSTLDKTAVLGPVAANPYAWPYDGSVSTRHVALVCIDWQVDFCGPGGYVDRMGYDLGAHPRRPAGRRRGCSPHARATGMLVIHTREGHAPDLSDLPAEQASGARRRSAPRSARPARADGSSSAASRAGRSCRRSRRSPARCIVDKPGKGAFYATNLDLRAADARGSRTSS